MKKLAFLLLGLIAFTITSCSDEDPSINIYPGEKITTAPVLEALPAPAEYVVERDVNELTVAGTFKWSPAVGEFNGTVAYFIEMAPAGNNFDDSVSFFAESVSTTSASFTFGNLNDALTRLNAILVEKGKESLGFGTLVAVDIRIKAIAELSQSTVYSLPQSLKINAYEADLPAEAPHLYLVGAPQAYYGQNAWDEKNGIELKYIGDGTTKLFEGYVKVAAGEGFKLTGDGKTWNNGNYGTDGAVAAISGGQEFSVIDSGGSSDLKVAEVDGNGLYYVKADMDNMTVKVIKMQWGVIGTATGGWSTELPMTYSFSTNEWTYAGTDLVASVEGLKFRSANTGLYINEGGKEWNYNVGDLLFVGWNETGKNFTTTAAGVNPKLKVGFDGTCVVTGL
jgi:hypothetical protein